jgi:exonuclease III
VKPIKVEHDLPGKFKDEKRLITAEYEDFYLVSTYVVNAGKF